MITSIADTYENIEGMIADIDRKHVEYTNASIDRIRYQMNADRSAKGKLIALLKHYEEEAVSDAMVQGSSSTATAIWTCSPFTTGKADNKDRGAAPGPGGAGGKSGPHRELS